MIVDDQFQTRNADLRFRNNVSARINCAQRIVRTHRHTCVRIFLRHAREKGQSGSVRVSEGHFKCVGCVTGPTCAPGARQGWVDKEGSR